MRENYKVEICVGPITIQITIDLSKFLLYITRGMWECPTVRTGRLNGEGFKLRPFVGLHRSVILYD